MWRPCVEGAGRRHAVEFGADATPTNADRRRCTFGCVSGRHRQALLVASSSTSSVNDSRLEGRDNVGGGTNGRVCDVNAIDAAGRSPLDLAPPPGVGRGGRGQGSTVREILVAAGATTTQGRISSMMDGGSGGGGGASRGEGGAREVVNSEKHGASSV